MEELLHYCWKHKILPLKPLLLTDGRSVEIINPGMHNTDAGPDFLDAKVKIDNVVWVGNVELHMKTSDWHRHRHDGNKAYDNIILHVACEVDEQLRRADGTLIPQLELTIPEYVRKNYDRLLSTETVPRCRDVVGRVSNLLVHSWLTALQVERLEMRTGQIMERREQLQKNWEDTLFVTVARAFGFGKNGDTFEKWAYSIPMMAVAKHKDNLMQIEAIFFGQAGLLEEDMDDEYFMKLKKEYRYLRQKFELRPIDIWQWKFLRLRPQNFPYVRIAQLAMLYYMGRLNLSRVMEAKGIEEITDLLSTHVSDYWRTHYSFGKRESRATNKDVSNASKQLLIINAIVPVIFSYGRYKGSEQAENNALQLLESIKAETNWIIKSWEEAGIQPENAADSQALLQLHTAYCLRRDCLRCRFGYEYIRHTPNFLKEEQQKEY